MGITPYQKFELSIYVFASLLGLFFYGFLIYKARKERCDNQGTLDVPEEIQQEKTPLSINETTPSPELCQLMNHYLNGKHHYLANCMNAISCLIGQHKHAEARICLNRFSQLLRGLLYENAGYVTFEREFELLRAFREVESLKQGKSFHINFIKKNSFRFEDYQIPSLFLQIPVENALLHGFSDTDKQPEISIYFEMRKKYLKVTIQDNGKGRSIQSIIDDNHMPKEMKLNLFDRLKIWETELSKETLHGLRHLRAQCSGKRKLKVNDLITTTLMSASNRASNPSRSMGISILRSKLKMMHGNDIKDILQFVDDIDHLGRRHGTKIIMKVPVRPEVFCKSKKASESRLNKACLQAS